MTVRTWLGSWPVYRQVTGQDRLGRGAAARSAGTEAAAPRTEAAERVVQSVCPYCAVGCGQRVYVGKAGGAEAVTQIEGDPDSPVSRGRLCPKGAASKQLVTHPGRQTTVLYRRPHGRRWEPLTLDAAMDMIADRVIAARAAGWQDTYQRSPVRRTLGIASLGGATLDNEENYLIKKLWSALGAIQIENQARIGHSATVPGLGTSFGRGGATTFPRDLVHSDCIVIAGSNMAECHPVAFGWVVEAKRRGATIIHLDPRFTRTSALATHHIANRAGGDIVLLGALVNHVLSGGHEFREYVTAYTNAADILPEDYAGPAANGGLFSGYDPDTRSYDNKSWQPTGERDPTLTHPRCVFQVLKEHFSQYTAELVEQVCGVSRRDFRLLADALVAGSGRERTTAWVYAVGWTQHTTGVQHIRTAAILQMLLGNMGRPGGGIMALRGHASIQGSTDIPTLFDLLPGYLPMPRAGDDTLEHYLSRLPDTGFWGLKRTYMVSLLKAWFGDAATAENGYCFDYLPRISGDHGTYSTVLDMIEGKISGYFLWGQNPAVGSAGSRLQRLALAKLDWLVVRDLTLIESATFWQDSPEIDTGELDPGQCATEVFFLPAASHVEKDGTFTNTQRMLQWHHKALDPPGDARSDLWFAYHLGKRIRRKLAAAADARDRPLLDLTWDYPEEGEQAEPSAEAVLAEINGRGPDGPLNGFVELADDGSTACGCWIYSGCFAGGVNQTARRKPHTQQSWVAPEWGWAWPMNRRMLYNRASADPQGRPWSEAKAYVWWDEAAGEWTGHDVPDCERTKPPGYQPPAGALGPAALAGTDPFIMLNDGRAHLFVPGGLADGPLPAHYEPAESPLRNAVYPQDTSPVSKLYPDHAATRGQVGGHDATYPCVVTTYRLTEHHTGGAMSRTLSRLAELQPELFCEVSPALAAQRGLENGGWATIVTARSAIEARVLVTRRVRPLRLADGSVIHQVGLPYHWGTAGIVTGDTVNDLLPFALDPNVYIQESKVATCQIVAGRRPRGRALTELVDRYRAEAGLSPLPLGGRTAHE